MPDQKEQIGTQDVFALRKDGKLAQALPHARRLHAARPDDPWTVRALAWCLYDEIKRLQKAGGTEELKRTKDELRKLALPEDDQLIQERVAQVLNADPAREASFRATDLSKQGRHHDAVKLLRRFARASDASMQVVEAYGWTLYRKLRDLSDKERDVAVWCLNEFLACWSEDWEPNPLLFKCVLIQAKIHAENWEGFVPLVERLGLHRLDPAVFADDRKDSEFQPFQDQLLTEIHKCVKKHESLRGERPKLLALLQSWLSNFGTGEWPEYRLGRILAWTGGDPGHARQLLLKTVQRNPSDFWRWQALAEVLEGPQRKIVLSRAICCLTDREDFKIPLFRDYAELLAAEGEVVAARASLREAIRLRELSGGEWREPMPTWFGGVSSEEKVRIVDYAEAFADRADELLAEGIDAHVCVILRPLKPAGRFLCLGEDEERITLKFRRGNEPARDVTAIRATYVKRDGRASSVLGWEPCEIPEAIGESLIGVVGHVNGAKRLSSVSTLKHDFVPLFHDRWPEAAGLKSGTILSLRMVTPPEAKPVVLTWGIAEPKLVPGFLIPVTGWFEMAPGRDFGFLNMAGSRIFVPPPEARLLRSSESVSGWAMRSKDKYGLKSWKLLPKT